MFRVGFTTILRKWPQKIPLACYSSQSLNQTTCRLRTGVVGLGPGSCRYYWRTTEINEKTELMFKAKDGIDESYRIIYKAPYQSMILGGHYFSYMSYAIVATMGYLATMSDVTFTESTFVESYAEYMAFLGLLGLSSFQVSAIVLHYPLRIYTEKDGPKFVAVFQGILPWKTSNVYFKADEVRQIQNLISGNNIFQLGPKKGYIIPHCFVRTEDFTKMTRLDEPTDD